VSSVRMRITGWFLRIAVKGLRSKLRYGRLSYTFVEEKKILGLFVSWSLR